MQKNYYTQLSIAKLARRHTDKWETFRVWVHDVCIIFMQLVNNDDWRNILLPFPQSLTRMNTLMLSSTRKPGSSNLCIAICVVLKGKKERKKHRHWLTFASCRAASCQLEFVETYVEVCDVVEGELIVMPTYTQNGSSRRNTHHITNDAGPFLKHTHT